jgi:DNA modification methylase
VRDAQACRELGRNFFGAEICREFTDEAEIRIGLGGG